MRSIVESNGGANSGRRSTICSFVLNTAAWLVIATAALGGADPASAQALRAPGGAAVHALLIGIDAYRNVRPLKGAVADARDVEGSLRRMGVEDVTLLLDAQVDRATVMRELEQLIQRSSPGDLVILSIAGHGTQEPEHVRGSEPDGMENVFLLTNFETTAEGSQQRIMGREFNHIIKRFEARGARVLFVADTCHGGGMAREVDPRAAEMSFRQVPQYRIPVDTLKPISSEADAFLTELDFEKTTFLAAVDRKTKAPEVRIPGVPGLRGALSYAVARAFEGGADMDGDGRITLKELFTNTRQVVYQLSDQRQNIVTMNSPNRSIDTDVVFELTRGVTVLESLPSTGPGSLPVPVPAPVATTGTGKIGPVRIASRDGQGIHLAALTQRETPFVVVGPSETPDLVWDPGSGDVLAGGDMIAQAMTLSDLPSVIERSAAVQGIKQLTVRAPQSVQIAPNAGLHRNESKVEIEVSGLAGRALLLFNIASNGTVQSLYPVESDPQMVKTSSYRVSVRVRRPFGAEQIVAITAAQPMTALEQAMRQLDQRRSPVQMLKMIERYGPPDARIGTVGLFTAP